MADKNLTPCLGWCGGLVRRRPDGRRRFFCAKCEEKRKKVNVRVAAYSVRTAPSGRLEVNGINA